MIDQRTDFERIFEALAAAEVRYVVVGGVAVVLQGFARLTADLDLVIALEPENVRRAMHALAELDYRPRAPVRAEDFADPLLRQQWITEKGMLVFSLWSPQLPATEVDCFVSEPLPFDRLYDDADTATVAGVAVPVASLADLIALKEQAGRPKDVLDVVELQKLLAGRSR